ncbi:MAG: hypothetical protein RLZZ298_1286 [Pseudomonadota bacterium]
MKRHPSSLSTHPKLRGFTLVEMAVVVAIIALMISGMMVPVGVMLDQRRFNETTDLLVAANDALVGFAGLNGHLPCPDRIGNDGVEDLDLAAGGNRCAPAPQDAEHAWGDLPYSTLGVNGFDAWGNRLRYSVEPRVTDTDRFASAVSASLIVTCSSVTRAAGVAGHIPGCHDPATGNPTELTSSAIFLVMSFGKNSFGAVSGGGNVFPAPTTADELNNIVAGGTAVTRRTFVSRMRTDIGTPAGEFDDLMIFMSSGQFTGLMQKAGQWPPTTP